MNWNIMAIEIRYSFVNGQGFIGVLVDGTSPSFKRDETTINGLVDQNNGANNF